MAIEEIFWSSLVHLICHVLEAFYLDFIWSLPHFLIKLFSGPFMCIFSSVWFICYLLYLFLSFMLSIVHTPMHCLNAPLFDSLDWLYIVYLSDLIDNCFLLVWCMRHIFLLFVFHEQSPFITNVPLSHEVYNVYSFILYSYVNTRIKTNIR